MPLNFAESGYTFKTDSLSFEQLRTRLFMIGTIQFEDQEKRVFLANIKGGFFNLNTALVGIQLNGSLLYISLYSQEGVISQHTNEGVINGNRQPHPNVDSALKMR